MANWREQLSLTKQSFQDGARSFPFLRVVMYEGTPQSRYDDEQVIRRRIAEDWPGRIELQCSAFNSADWDRQVSFALCDAEANRAGCVLFSELATAAGACLPDQVPGLPRGWPDFAPTFAEGKWLQLIFAAAESGRAGNLLQVALFGCQGKCAFLIPNPFLASVAMIDEILNWPESDGQRAEEPKEDGPIGADGFRYKGKEEFGLTPRAFQLVSSIWAGKEHAAQTAHCETKVYGQFSTPRYTATASLLREACRFFKKAKMPLRAGRKGDMLRIVDTDAEKPKPKKRRAIRRKSL